MTPRTTFVGGISCFPTKPPRKHPPQSAEVIADVRAMHAAGVLRKVIAAKHGVSIWTVHNIINKTKCYENL